MAPVGGRGPRQSVFPDERWGEEIRSTEGGWPGWTAPGLHPLMPGEVFLPNPSGETGGTDDSGADGVCRAAADRTDAGAEGHFHGGRRPTVEA